MSYHIKSIILYNTQSPQTPIPSVTVSTQLVLST